jgi:hypothetical protein
MGAGGQHGAFGVTGPDDVEIVRGDLTSILYEAARNDVEYVFDDSITEIIEAPDVVDVTFELAGSRAFRLVAGATGCTPRYEPWLSARGRGSSGTWACTCQCSPSLTTWASITGS